MTTPTTTNGNGPAYLKALARARAVSTPLIAISTPDPAAVTAAIRTKWPEAPILAWDCAVGLAGLNAAGQAAASKLAAGLGGLPLGAATTGAVEMLGLIAQLPADSIVLATFLHRFTDRPEVVQAVWNLRDRFKIDGRCLVILGPSVTWPPEIAQDLLILEHPLPDDAALAAIVREQHHNAGLDAPSDETVAAAVDAVRGLAEYPAEQVTVMSLTKAGLDMPALWERKRSTIEQTAGLTIDRWPHTFSDIGGLKQIRWFAEGLFGGAHAPRVIVRLEELEKMFAGLGVNGGPGDNTGATQYALAAMLNDMEDQGYTGILTAGVPGGGKSLISKAMGATFKRPSFSADFGALKTGELGGSERLVRAMMNTIKAVAGPGGALFVATVNDLNVLPAALRRRFTLGIWYFDVPDHDEREAIWEIQLQYYGLDRKQPRPDAQGWTGAEIRNCCDVAQRLGCSLIAAASLIVPVTQADPDGIERLRTQAHGRWLSASYPGPYRRDLVTEGATVPQERRINLG